MSKRRKTLEEHLRDGTYRADRHGPLPDGMSRDRPPTPQAPPKPDGLSPAASAFWDEVVRARKDYIFRSDGPMLVMLVEWWDLWRGVLKEAKDAVAEMSDGPAPPEFSSDGRVKKSKLRKRPSLKDLLTSLGICTDKVASLGSKFGLSPTDRAKMPVVDKGPKKAKVATRPRTSLDRNGPPKEPVDDAG